MVYELLENVIFVITNFLFSDSALGLPPLRFSRSLLLLVISQIESVNFSWREDGETSGEFLGTRLV